MPYRTTLPVRSKRGAVQSFNRLGLVFANSAVISSLVKVARTERVPDQTDAHIRIYNCPVCGHEMRLTRFGRTTCRLERLQLVPRWLRLPPGEALPFKGANAI